MGTPAVGYDVPRLRDSIMHHETGLHVPLANPKALAHAALGLLTDPSELKRLADNALRWSRRFDWDRKRTRYAGSFVSWIST